MESLVTVRLDEATRRRVARLASRKGVSTSEVIREAIQALVERHEASASPYEGVADLIGAVHGGDPKRSVGGGRQFMRLLKDRRKRR